MSRTRLIIYGILSHVAFVAVWQLATMLTDLPSYILPSPIETINELFEPSYNWSMHIWATTLEIVGGYVLAVIVGVALAVLFVWAPVVNAGLMPLLVTINMVPKVAMARCSLSGLGMDWFQT